MCFLACMGMVLKVWYECLSLNFQWRGDEWGGKADRWQSRFM